MYKAESQQNQQRNPKIVHKLKNMDINKPFIVYSDNEKSNEYVKPKNGEDFKLAQLKEIVGGHIEICETQFPGVIMIIDEEGKLKQKEINRLATHMYKYGEHDPIVGNVLICNSKQVL